MQDCSDLFQYESPSIPEGCIGISPSGIYKFFDYPSVWYRENFLGEESEFKGNTASVTGTICHYIYEKVSKGEPVDREGINAQLIAEMSDNPDVNMVEVMATYPSVAMAVVNEYVLKHQTKNLWLEEKIAVEYRDGIYIKGTYDRLEGTVLCDYKNVSRVPNEPFPFKYLMQLMAYAWALRKTGKIVDSLRLIYGIKPTKTLPARCLVADRAIDYELEQQFKDCMDLIADTCLKAKEDPSLVYLLFKSMKLKEA